MRNPLTLVRRRERHDAEIARWREESRDYGSCLKMLHSRLAEYRERTQGLTPRAAIVGEVFFHEIQMELADSLDRTLPLHWMPEKERVERLKDCPIPTEGAVGALCWRGLWIVGNHSQQDAFVFIQ